jgi:DMATS type aromatic prenyltransferase
MTRSAAEAALHGEPSTVPLGELGLFKLMSLCRGLALSRSRTVLAERVFALLSKPWAAWDAGATPPWPNDITDDGSPFEFSLAMSPDGATDLRMLVESQLPSQSPTSTWTAGLALNARLQEAQAAFGFDPRVDLTLFDNVRDLFAPDSSTAGGRFSLWHAAVLAADGRTSFKAYLNPQLRGVEQAGRVTGEAFQRLGLGHRWDWIATLIGAADSQAQVKYLSVDLVAPAAARVKVYACFPSLRSSAIAGLIGAAGGGDLTSALELLMGSERQRSSRPILVCFAFRAGPGACQREGMVAEATAHVPIRHHVAHDGESLARLSQLLSPAHAERLTDAASAMAERPLQMGRGLVTYASVRMEDQAAGPRVTAYLAPEVYAIASPRRARRVNG